jgi:hypothetical protein
MLLAFVLGTVTIARSPFFDQATPHKNEFLYPAKLHQNGLSEGGHFGPFL